MTGPLLSDRQRFSWLKLIRVPNIGPATFRDLINRFGSAEAALDGLPELVRTSGSRRSFPVPPDAAIEKELGAAQRLGARFIALGEPDYPALLAAIDFPPPILAVWGSSRLFAMPTVGIVGARNASLNGAKIARRMGTDLGRMGFGIASGLARGIDTAAHQGALSAGTIAVLAGGLDRPYPPENIPLLQEIANNGGAAVSEMPFGWEPRAQDFPRRNRIIAGLSLGLVVVEAAQRSGSLISARMAGEMGRIVFAVPGSPLDPRAAGTNGLLKQGATLVTEAADVAEMLTPLAGRRPEIAERTAEPTFIHAAGLPVPPAGGDVRGEVLRALGPSPVPVDDLIAHTGLTPAQIATVLLELDLAGRLERHAGGTVSLSGAERT